MGEAASGIRSLAPVLELIITARALSSQARGPMDSLFLGVLFACESGLGLNRAQTSLAFSLARATRSISVLLAARLIKPRSVKVERLSASAVGSAK